MFPAVAPTAAEVFAPRPGDEIVASANVVMNRGFSLDASPEEVWPWIVQLGKDRAGWYLPHSIERMLPHSRRALHRIDPAFQGLEPGDVIPDWGGKGATFETVRIDPPDRLVSPGVLIYRSTRGRVQFSWAITVGSDSASRSVGESTVHGVGASRVHLRLRLGSVRHVGIAESVGAGFDLLTIAGLAAGLRERLGARPAP